MMTRVATKIASLLGMVVLAALSCAGCKSGPEDNSKLGVYLVNTKQTSFYRFGPAQNNGPDFNLQNGQRVAMLEYDRAFSKVMMENGFSGYVATEDLKAAPPPPKQSKSSGIFGRRRGGQSAGPSEVLESGPLFDQFNLPPLPEDPEPGGEPVVIPQPETKVPLPLPR